VTLSAIPTYNPYQNIGALDGDDPPLEWDDLRFPASQINPLGSVSPPSIDDTLDGVTGTLLFSGSQENVVAVQAQMSHAWKRGSSVRPHIHWEKTTQSSNAVTWELYYRHIGNPGDTKGAWVGPVAPDGTIGDHTADGEQLLTYWPMVEMTNFKESAMTSYRIHRVGDTDAYAGTARLYEFDIHYAKDKNGTPTEVPT
jgi:hypothetical protein